MKLRLPYALLCAALISTSYAEQVTVSTMEELRAAIDDKHFDIKLSDSIFTDTGFSQTILVPESCTNFTLSGVRDKTIFRAVTPGSSAFSYQGKGFLSLENCVFENFSSLGARLDQNDPISSVSGAGGAISSTAIGGGATNPATFGCVFNFLTFRNNNISSIRSSGIVNSSGGAFSTTNTATISNCAFIGNSSRASGDAVYSRGGAVYLSVGGDQALVQRCLFEGNYAEALNGMVAQASSGALCIPRGTVTDSIFKRNYVKVTAITTGNIIARGGAIGTIIPYYNSQTTIKNCLFEANYASAEASYGDNVMAQGGALYGVFSIQDSDFYNNYTMKANYSQGGAIFASSVYENGGSRSLLSISAVEKDSIFRYNRMGVTQVDPVTGKPLDGIANSIYAYPETIKKNADGKWYTYTTDDSVFSFRARAGRSVLFYDPMVLQMGMIQTAPCTQTLELNKADADGTQNEGRIVFTGEDFSETDNAENWTSRFYYNMDARLYNGTLVIKDKAIVGAPYIVDDSFVKPEEGRDGSYDSEIGLKSFTMDKGTLEITGKGHLMARKVTINGGHELSTLRTGTGAMLTARSVDISTGVSFDFAPFLDGAQTGLHISADSVTLGGTMGVSDTLDYYADRRWGNSQEYTALSFTPETAATLDGTDFDEIVSLTTGSASIESPYTYQGYWTKEWRDSDGDGILDKLFAIWTPTGGITDVAPEQAGDATLNDLWSTVSNMQAMSDIALGQIGVNRYKLQQCSNYWVNTIGDFDMHRSVGGRDGYDYNGFGYAVGGDFRITCPDTWLVGAAFGNLYGKNKSRNFFAETKQTTYIGLLYGGYYKEFNPKHALNITASASWGTTRNRMSTSYRDGGGHSEGKWNSRAMRYTLRGEWIRNLDENWNLTPFLGLEYDDARQSSFGETGDKARRFGKGNLRNLAMPVGVGIWRADTIHSDRVWINGIELSYSPDIYRDNPTSTAQRYDNDFMWTARGVAASRHAGRASYSTRIVWNKTWSTFAGYELEWRTNAVYQQTNIGMSASF